MNKLIKTGRLFFCLGMIGMCAQQFYYADFRPVFTPPLSTWIPWISVWAFLLSIIVISLCFSILLEKNGQKASLILGGLLFIIMLLTHIPYELFVDPYSNRLGSWTNTFKELALSGSAFVVAGSFKDEKNISTQKSFVFDTLKNIIPYGKIFFSIMLIAFGICHFLYTEFVKNLVPDWIPHHVFWTYVAGIALIGSGLSIVLNFKRRFILLLLSSILFIWFVILHIPRAINSTAADKGNELTSVFQALAFSGIALLIAYGPGGFGKNQRNGEVVKAVKW